MNPTNPINPINPIVINNMKECIEHSNRLDYWCKTNKSISPSRCDKMKEKYLEYCRQNFITFFQNQNHPQSSSENNEICRSVNNLGGNTLNDMIKSPVTSGERENPFDLMIFSSRF